MSDAARHLGIPQQTFHRWARGYPKGGPMLHVAEPESILGPAFLLSRSLSLSFNLLASSRCD